MKNAKVGVSIVGLFGILLTGCKTVTISSRPRIAIPPSALTKSIADFPALKPIPIVDIHSHTFNARYLPLENIAVARHYDVLFGLISFFPDPSVKKLANWIVENSKLADLDGKQAPLELEGTPHVKAELVQMKAQNLRNQIAAALAKPDAPTKGPLKTLEQVTEADRKKADQTVRRLFGDTDPQGEEFSIERREDGDIPNGSLYRFIYFLQRDEKVIRNELTTSEFPEIALFVHHMMDLAPVYGQTPDGEKLLDFRTQIKRTERLDEKTDGKFIHFVAFSPYRARTHIGIDFEIDFEAAWRPVQEALDHGAWGVKFYPPSGYRPASNNIPVRPWLVPALRKQWEARYEGWSDSKLDDVMLKFFTRCADRNIPVFTHSGHGEFQAAKKYGPMYADPKYWRKLFEKNPGLKNLRLCLGHAGGEDFWYGEGKYKSWGDDVVKLCLDYPNVFCEFGASDGIVKPKNQLMFANRILEITQQHPEFAKKIMYGSDWFMPMSINPRSAYLDAYRQVFLTEELRDHYKDFFCRNAIRFLEMDDKRIGADPLLSPQGKAQLRKLVEKAAK